MDSLKKLQRVRDLRGLAKLLGYKPKSVSYILYKIPAVEKYRVFSIPKAGGGKRSIKAPIAQLKDLQHRLADLLQSCYEEINENKSYSRSLSHGFRKNHSIITNARNHRSKRYVFNIDLKDFFPSINFGRVRGFFIKSNDFQLDPRVATVIAQIACHDNELPQGSPSSPIISNLLGHVLDIRLVRLAKKAGCTFSRYADDITFSTRAKTFSPLIARQVAEDVWEPSDKLHRTIAKTGFSINSQKVSMQYVTNRQITTGLVVNKKVNIQVSYYRQARAMCNSLFRTGSFYTKKADDKSVLLNGTIDQLHGILSHIYNVKRCHDDREISEQQKKPTAIRKLFRKFLYFEKFHYLTKPLIFCEGKTDCIYLKCALKSMHSEYPSIIEMAGSDFIWKVDFFKHSKLNLNLMRFSGGVGDFEYLIPNYQRKMKPFICNGRAYPVILLVDNDAGANKVLKAASRIIDKEVDGSQNFYRLADNLYLVVLSLASGNTPAEIEDCFEPEVTLTKLDGKSFSQENEYESSTYYGKNDFAQKVVKPNQRNINFKGFEPTLRRIEAAIADYADSLKNS